MRFVSAHLTKIEYCFVQISYTGLSLVTDNKKNIVIGYNFQYLLYYVLTFRLK